MSSENLSAGVLPENMSREQLEMLARVLEARGLKVTLPKVRNTQLKVSVYGHVEFHAEGVRKPGVGLYIDEWACIIENIERIKEFIASRPANAITLEQGRAASKARKAAQG